MTDQTKRQEEPPGCHPIGLGIGFFALMWALLCLVMSVRW
ncbi:hypothetical protein ABIA32_006314 [Streptacidiphilus sp. MAP12-20]